MPIKPALFSIALFFVWGILPSQAQEQKNKKGSLIGTTYNGSKSPNRFKGWEDIGGLMLTPLNGTDYGVHQYKKGTSHVFLLEMLISYDETGNNPIWKILDTLTVSGVNGGRFTEPCICTKNGKDPDELLVGLYNVPASADYKRGYYSIMRVWQANRKLARFVATSKEGVKAFIVGSD